MHFLNPIQILPFNFALLTAHCFKVSDKFIPRTITLFCVNMFILPPRVKAQATYQECRTADVGCHAATGCWRQSSVCQTCPLQCQVVRAGTPVRSLIGHLVLIQNLQLIHCAVQTPGTEQLVPRMPAGQHAHTFTVHVYTCVTRGGFRNASKFSILVVFTLHPKCTLFQKPVGQTV